MARLNRRDFLKALGLAGATTAAACGWDDNWYRTPVEEILPYVVRPEQVTPGTPTFFATSVTTGPNAWPVTGRHRDGRVINVGANKQAGLPTGVPKDALLELQRHYSPDRIKAPMASGAELSWTDAVQKLQDAVSKATAEGKKVAWIGPYRSGSMAQLLSDYTGGNAVHWEPLGRAGEADAYELLFGKRALPRYALSGAHYVLSFGAPFLGAWGGPQLEHDFAKAKNPNEGGFIARFGLVSPHMDQTGAKSDDWYACAHNSQVAAAFAIAKLIADKKGYAGSAASILSGVDTSAPGSGLSAEQLNEIADRFASASAAVALPGAADDADLAVATFLINVVSGNAGKTFLDGGYEGPVHGTRHVAELVADMKAGNVGVLIVDDTNPAYSLPPALGFADALKSVGLVVSASGQPTETSALAGLILPVNNTLEDWGDEDLDAATHLLRQPTMTPLWSSMSLGDILLATARGANRQPLAMAVTAPVEGEEPAAEDTDAAAAPGPLGFEPKTFRDYVMKRWERDIHSQTSRMTGFTQFWVQSLQKGLFRGASSDVAPTVQAASYTVPASAAVAGIGLALYAHPHRGDGKYSNAAWSQEIADPMTGQVWDSWVEISPDLASELGVKDKDLVEIKTAGGSVQVGVEVYKGLQGKNAALAFGQGHTEAFGRYAKGRGVNAYSLVAGDVKDSQGNVLMVATGATISKVAGTSDLVSTIGGDSDGGRYWGVSVNADALAKVGDKPQAHGGELTGIHHLPRDTRLDEKQRYNFYNPPDHPTYRFAMTVDTNACDGCGICVVACSAENNLPVVGKSLIRKGREMNWLRINRYWETTADGHADVRFVPVMCQHCALAPCESVCPVLATYHNIDGLNAMVYNRCVGTRYCANNCPYVVRRFNFHSYTWPQPLHLQLNPDITVRTMGVMEKCTFCVQRTRRIKDAYRDQGFNETVPNEALEQLPACAEACPTNALTFGNLNDAASTPAKSRKSARSYVILSELNTESAVNYLAKASFHVAEAAHHGGGHGEHAEGGEHADTHGGDAHGAPAAEHHDGGGDKHDKAEHHDGAGEHSDAEHH